MSIDIRITCHDQGWLIESGQYRDDHFSKVVESVGERSAVDARLRMAIDEAMIFLRTPPEKKDDE